MKPLVVEDQGNQAEVGKVGDILPFVQEDILVVEGVGNLDQEDIAEEVDILVEEEGNLLPEEVDSLVEEDNPSIEISIII